MYGLCHVLTGAGEEGEHDNAIQELEEHAAEKERTVEGPTQTPVKVSEWTRGWLLSLQL